LALQFHLLLKLMAGNLNLLQTHEKYGKYSLRRFARKLLFFLIISVIAFNGDSITPAEKG